MNWFKDLKEDEIKCKYKKLILLLHPDALPEHLKEIGNELVIDINNQYDRLQWDNNKEISYQTSENIRIYLVYLKQIMPKVSFRINSNKADEIIASLNTFDCKEMLKKERFKYDTKNKVWRKTVW